TELLEPLLVGDAEMLLLIDDEEAQIFELDAPAEERVGANRDVGLPLRNALLHLRKVLAGHEPRGLPDLEREVAEALGEGFGVLAREQRRRRDDCNLLAVHRGRKGCA